MNVKTYVFVSIFLTIYGLINFYIARRGWQALSGYHLIGNWGRYWFIVVIVMALMFPLARFVSSSLPVDLSRILIIISSYWLGIMYYLLLIVLSLDLVRLLDRVIGFLPVNLKTPHPDVALAIGVVIIGLQIYGTWNAHHPVVKNYDITLNRKSSQLDSVHIVAVSDIHLGWVVGADRLNSMIKTINSLKPDLVLLVGDIIDEGVESAAEESIPMAFSALTPRLGAFAVLGNHEYISHQADAVTKYLGQGGVKVLRDQYLEIDNNLLLVGRDDLSSRGFAGQTRLDLASLMEGANTKLPILLMDHQPFNLQEAEQASVDLQFSGHTHRGQIAPNNLITRKIYEQDWGYLKKDHLQLLVSCGFGTWGPPIRIGNRPEILNIQVKLVPSK